MALEFPDVVVASGFVLVADAALTQVSRGATAGYVSTGVYNISLDAETQRRFENVACLVQVYGATLGIPLVTEGVDPVDFLITMDDGAGQAVEVTGFVYTINAIVNESTDPA